MLIAAAAGAAGHHGGVTPFESAAVVAAIGLVGIITTAVLGTLFGRWAEATNRRRDRYADAVSTLVAWAEYPYRIRRRTSDTPEELGRLADLGHDLQERLRRHHTWIITENEAVGRIFEEALSAISSRTGPACKDAWQFPPVTSPIHMNLNGWGPEDPRADIERLQRCIASRFGLLRHTRAICGSIPIQTREGHQ